MKDSLRLPLGVLAIASSLLVVSAQTIISDGFQSYTDDTSLTTVWGRVSGTSSTIFLTTDPNDVNNQVIQQTTAAGRLRQTFAGTLATDENPLVFSFDFYDVNGGTTSGRMYGELRNSGSASGLFAAGLFNTVNTGTFAQGRYQARDLDSGGWIQLDTARSVGWHNFQFEIRANTVDLYVDGVLDPQFSNLSYSGGVSYDWFHLGSALTGNTLGYFDNASLAVVPEPSTWALLALGAIGFGCFAKRRRA